MKFINKSKKSIEVRTGERFNHLWIKVSPGETIDIPVKKGKRYGFKKVSDIPDSKSKLKVTEGKIGKTKVETKQIDDSKQIKTKIENDN